MPTPPPELKRGPKWLREMVNSLRQFVIEVQPVPGIGTTVNDSPSGRSINARGGGGQASKLLAFQLIDASENSEKRVRIIAGTINGQFPPGMSAGDKPEYVLSVNGSGVIYVGVTVNASGAITSRFVGKGDEIPDDEEETTFHYALGSFSVSGQDLSIVDNRGGPITFTACRKWFSSTPAFTPDWRQ